MGIYHKRKPQKCDGKWKLLKVQTDVTHRKLQAKK